MSAPTNAALLPLTATFGAPINFSDTANFSTTRLPRQACGGIAVTPENTGPVPLPGKEASFKTGLMRLPTASCTPEAVSVSNEPSRISLVAQSSVNEKGPPDTPEGDNPSVPEPGPVAA
ncbi:MAG: hypothetical protein BWY09_01758 [Candidatus Hydrogenedentes bacterium ADurb.Bin179]|nr:MAG: hypothetical protein BWY09_01758 [Candidatus Hydrogenedentes bacterium ADurb.Bin179]